MKKVLKSYVRTYLKQWIESLGLILFVTILSLVVIGMLAAPLQLSNKNNRVNKESNTWNYSLLSTPSKFENQFTYDYFVANSEDYYLAPIIDKNNDPNGYGILSADGYAALLVKDNDPKNGNIDNQSAWGEDIKNILTDYFNFADTPTNLTDNNGNVLTANQVFNSIFKDTIKNYYNDVSYYVNSKIIEANNTKFAMSSDLEFYYEAYSSPTSIIADGYFYITSGEENINPSLHKWINNLVMLNGTNDTTNNSIVITDKFAKDNNYKLNDKLNFESLGTLVPELNNPIITGFGTKVDTMSQSSYFSTTGDSLKYAAVFVNNNVLENMYQNVWLTQNKPKKFDFGINQKINFLNNSNFATLKETFAKKSNSDNTVYMTSSGVLADFNSLNPISRISSMKVTTTIYTLLGVGMIVLAFIFISFVMKKEMNKTRKQLGIFKALGYRTKELSWIFTVKTLITILGGLILGYLISIPLQMYMYGQFQSMVTISYDKVYTGWGFMLVIFLIIPIFFTVASYVTTFLYIKEPILSLINNAAKSKNAVRQGWISRSLSKSGKAFTWRLQLAFTARNKGKFALVIILFFFSTLMLILMLGATNIAKSIIGGVFNTMNSNLDHSSNFKNFPKINGQSNNRLAISDVLYKQYDFKFKAYHNTGDIISTNKTADDFHSAFIKIDPSSTSTAADYMNLFRTIDVQNTNGENQYMYLKDLKTIFTVWTNSNYFLQIGLDPNQYPNFMLLMLNAMMMDNNANTVVTFNDFWYNPQQETTFYSIPIIPEGNFDEPNMQITGLNNSINVGGLYTNGLNWSGVTQKQINEVFNVEDTPNKIKGLITYKIARNGNFKVGDVIKVKTETPNKIPVDIKIVGIVKNATITGDIYTSYNNLINNLFVNNTIDENKPEENIYTGLYSQQKMYEGKIDLQNMADSIQNLKFIGNNLVLAALPNQKLWDALTSLDTKTVSATLMNSMIGSSTSNNDFSVLPLNILRASVDDMLAKQNNSMIMFEVLVALVILILLVVVVMVVIDEVVPIILTMKATGYNNRQINFVVMGSYVIAVIITFVIAWLASVLVWQGLGILMYTAFKVVLNIPIDIQGPLIALAIVTVILLTSWLSAMNSIKNRCVTEITD